MFATLLASALLAAPAQNTAQFRALKITVPIDKEMAKHPDLQKLGYFFENTKLGVYVWTKGMEEGKYLFDPSNSRTTHAIKYTDTGYLLGTTTDKRPSAFRIDPGGRFDTIPGLFPKDINRKGEIVGSAAVGEKAMPVLIKSDGKIVNLPLPQGAISGEAHAINDQQDIVGLIEYSDIAIMNTPMLDPLGKLYKPENSPLNRPVLCIWSRTGQLFTAISNPSETFKSVSAISNDGTIVGYSELNGVAKGWIKQGTAPHSFLIPNVISSDPTANVYHSAFSINSRGVAVGGAGGVTVLNQLSRQKSRATIDTPVIWPTSAQMFLLQDVSDRWFNLSTLMNCEIFDNGQVVVKAIDGQQPFTTLLTPNRNLDSEMQGIEITSFR